MSDYRVKIKETGLSEREFAKQVSMRVVDGLIQKIQTNPEPSDWAFLVSFYGIIHESFNVIVDKKRRIAIVKMVEEFKRRINERVRKADAEVILREGKVYLVKGGKEYRLGYNEVWSLMASRNIEDIVEDIVNRAEGRVYNTKYYPIEKENVKARI